MDNDGWVLLTWEHEESRRRDLQALGFEDGRDGERQNPDYSHARAYLRGYEEGVKWVGYYDRDLPDDIRNTYTWHSRCNE